MVGLRGEVHNSIGSMKPKKDEMEVMLQVNRIVPSIGNEPN